MKKTYAIGVATFLGFLIISCTNVDQKSRSETILSNREQCRNAETQLEDAKVMVAKDDYPSAYRLLLESANCNNPEAQLNVGEFNFNGVGTAKNIPEAERWFKRAAQNEYAPAQYGLALLYEYKTDTPNLEESARWLKRAASHGYVPAQAKLGVMYIKGKGLPQDKQEGYIWIQRAAESGDAGAQYNIGRRYLAADGVPYDIQKAVIWYEKAAEGGNSEAQVRLGLMYAKPSDGVLQDYNRAIYLFKKSAAQGNAVALKSLGIAHVNGDGVKKDLTLALFFFKAAALNGETSSQEYIDLISKKMSKTEINKSENLLDEFQKTIQLPQKNPEQL